MDLAGHRTTAPHDCFLADCRGLGPEVDLLRAQIVELATENTRLQEIIDAEWGDPAPVVGVSYADAVEAVQAKGGEVGAITGPPIVGTTDDVNAGPAKR